MQEAVQALALDIRYEDLPSFDRPQAGVYCLARPTNPNRATPTDPSGPEVTIAYLRVDKAQNDKPQTWLRSAFTAYANQQSIDEIKFLRDQRTAERRKGWAKTALGASIGLGAAIVAIVSTWTYKELADGHRYASMNQVAAEKRLALAHSEIERVGVEFKAYEERIGQVQQANQRFIATLEERATELENKGAQVDMRVGLVQSDLTTMQNYIDRISDDIIFMQEATLSSIWGDLNSIETHIITAGEELASRETQLDNYKSILNAWDQLGSRANHFGQMLQARYPAYQYAAQMLGRMNRNETDMNRQAIAYLSQLRDLTEVQLRSTALMRMDGSDSALFHQSVNEWAAFKAQFTSPPKNTNIKYAGNSILITATNCDEAIAMMGNILDIPPLYQAKFKDTASGICKPSGNDLRTAPSFPGHYKFGGNK